MDEQNRHRPLQPPRRVLEVEQRLDRAGDEPRFAVQKEERDHADERRQHDRQRDQGAECLAARKIEPLEQKREGDADRRRQNHAHQ